MLYLQARPWQQAATTETPLASDMDLLSIWLPHQPQQLNGTGSTFGDLAGHHPATGSGVDASESSQQAAGPAGLLPPAKAPSHGQRAHDAMQTWQLHVREAGLALQTDTDVSTTDASTADPPALSPQEALQLHIQQAPAPAKARSLLEKLNGPISDQSALDLVTAWQQGQQQQQLLLLGPAAHAALANGIPLAELAFPDGPGSLLKKLSSLFAAQMLQQASACVTRGRTLDLGTIQEPDGFDMLCADRPVGSVIVAALTKNVARLAMLQDQVAAAESSIESQLGVLAKLRLQRLQVGKDLVANIIRPTLQQYASLLRPMGLLKMALLLQSAEGSRPPDVAANHPSAAGSSENAARSLTGSLTLSTGSQAGALALPASHAGVGNLARSTATGSVDWWELALPVGLAGVLLAFALAAMLSFRCGHTACLCLSLLTQ